MAERRRYAADEITVVWLPPERLQAQRVQEAVDAGASAQEVADLAARTGQGEYREWLGEELKDGRYEAKFGDRFRWVHPEGEDGYYERVPEGEDYSPVVYGENAR